MSEFDKIIGYEGIKLELQRICDVVKNPEKYAKLGVTVPKGIVLEGDPGLGKTLMAKCFIKECGCKTFTIRKDSPNGDFVKRIKETYDKAQNESMAIVFLDDMDKFANEDKDHCDAEEYVTVQACIDECVDNNVFSIATVNEMWRLPDSLTRAGRFDKVIELARPKGPNAHKIIKHFLKSKKVIGNLDLEEITRYLEDYSCAEIEMIINEAGIYAGFEGRKKIERKDILEAILREHFGAPLGNEDDDPIKAREIAAHEVGHALVYEILVPGAVNFISIHPSGNSTKGITTYSILHDNSIEHDKNRITRMLGGKAAVEIVYGKADAGCQADIDSAYRVAKRLVDEMCVFGFDAFVDRNSSDTTRNNKDKMTQLLIEKQFNLAKQIIMENRVLFDAILDELIETEIITYKDIARIRKRIEGLSDDVIHEIPLSA